jgi:hypothetical protein
VDGGNTTSRRIKTVNISAAIVKTILVAAILAPPVVSFADCPEGVRPTTVVEQQKYLAAMTALKAALPTTVSGYEVKMDQLFTTAPSSVCKGSPLTAGYDATYTSVEQRKKNQEAGQQYEARIEAVRKLSPEQQKQADDLYNQGKALGYQSIAALKNKDQAESDRLRAEANKKYAESKAIQQAHLEKVFPQMKAIEDEKQAAYVSPEVRVHLVGRDLAADRKSPKSEAAPIEGGPGAYFSADRALVVSLGTSPDGQPVWARLEGDRTNVQAIARQLSPVSAGAGQLQSKNR